MIGPENSRHYLNQSDSNQKPTLTWWLAFSRAPSSFFLLHVLIGSCWNFPFDAIGCFDYFTFVFRAPKHRFRILDASVFAFYWDKNSVFRPLQTDVSVTTTTTFFFFFSRGRLKLLIRAFTFEDLACVLISILSLLCVGRKVVSTPRMLADWGWLPLWPGFDSLAWCQLTPEFFSRGPSVFLPPQKTTFLIKNLTWKKWTGIATFLYYRTQNLQN